MSNTAQPRPTPPIAQPVGVSKLLAVFFCGTTAFLNLYCTQPMLPMLSHLFKVSETQVGITVSASTIGVAVSAMVLALFGERLPRKRAIVFSMLLLATITMLTGKAYSLHTLALGRLLQGLATPGIFILTIAYITDEFPALEVPRVMSSYVAGTVFGGFTGRFLGGIIAQHYGWHMVFFALSLGGFLGAAVTAALLPAARHRHAQQIHSIWAPVLANLRNPRLLATFGIGFCMLFTLVSTFSFVTFHLAAPPFNLSTARLSQIFAVYLVGLLSTLAMGQVLARIGLRSGMLVATGVGITGILTTLIPSLPVIAAGLALTSSCVFIAQTCANSFLRDAAPSGGRVSAAGMYICVYYLGGTLGGMLPGLAIRHGGWTACCLMIAGVIALAALITFFGWTPVGKRKDPIPLSART
ncbi:MAG: MFS transporter [Acidobacteriaceae bacterium]|nr:MFS transporter [Acidobacteriaceae bacterium]